MQLTWFGFWCDGKSNLSPQEDILQMHTKGVLVELVAPKTKPRVMIGPSGNAIDFVFLKSRVEIQLADIHPTHSFILIRLCWTVFGSAVSGKKVTDG